MAGAVARCVLVKKTVEKQGKTGLISSTLLQKLGDATSPLPSLRPKRVQSRVGR